MSKAMIVQDQTNEQMRRANRNLNNTVVSQANTITALKKKKAQYRRERDEARKQIDEFVREDALDREEREVFNVLLTWARDRGILNELI